MRHYVRVAAAALGGVLVAFAVEAAPNDYKFELAGPPTAVGGKSVVRLRLLHLPDNKPVAGAVVFEVRADMGPDGMPTMTSAARALPEAPPGTYPIEVQPDMAGNWAISVAAKVQGEAETVRGSVAASLKK